jgi:ATP-binding cassette subfamily G (WHITE) protein 2 (PDR)
VQPAGGDSREGHAEFAMPFSSQLWHVSKRVFQNYWRTPSYLFGKFILGIASALFIGFSFFQSDDSQQGLQNCIFGIFMARAPPCPSFLSRNANTARR